MTTENTPDKTGEKATETPGPGDPRGKTVLVVDDDESILNLLEVLVGSGGFKVLTAATGEDAIKKLARNPDGIILDLVMPGCGGLGVLEHLRHDPGPKPPIFVISAFQDTNPVLTEATKDPNVTQFLRKPINHPALLAALHKHLKTEPLKAKKK